MYLKTTIKIIAFDFDQTIIKTHSIMNDWTPKSVERMTINQIVQVTSELFNFDQFITFIKNQHQIGRAKYVITSYGSKSVIEAFLRRLGIYYLFDHILTPEKFGLIDGYNVCRELNGKNVMLDMISKYYKAFHEEILLIDDSQINIDTAKSARYATIKVDPAKALTVNDGYFIELFLHQKIKV